MHAISSYHGNGATNKPTNTQTNIEGRLQYTAPQLSSSVIKFATSKRPGIGALDA